MVLTVRSQVRRLYVADAYWQGKVSGIYWIACVCVCVCVCVYVCSVRISARVCVRVRAHFCLSVFFSDKNYHVLKTL